MESRIAAFLTVAAAHRQRHLVLGAFGCGVFGGDIRVVARQFADLLRGRGRFAGRFEGVTFAVIDEEHRAAFEAAFR